MMHQNFGLRSSGGRLPALSVLGMAAVLSLLLSPPRARCHDESAPSYPPDSSLTVVQTPNMPRPEYLETVKEPAFGNRVTRISDQTKMGVDLSNEQHIRNVYSKKSAWNADGSIVMLASVRPALLLSATNYRLIKRVQQPEDATWSNTKPNILYGVQSRLGNLIAFDTKTEKTTVIKHFDGFASLSLGRGEGNLSDDDRWAALYAKDANGDGYAITYDLSTGKQAIQNLGPTEPDWIGMSHSGKYVIIQWQTGGSGDRKGVTVWDTNLKYLRNISSCASHGDVAYDTTGREIYVSGTDCQTTSSVPCKESATYSAYPLDGSQSFPLVSKSVGSNANAGHISGRNINRKGWIYLSVYSSIARYAGKDEVFALKIDPKQPGTRPIVNRFSHVHHDPDLPYATIPFAVPNADGSKVLFGSEWNMGANSPTYAYVTAR
jgi:hypothetical protein